MKRFSIAVAASTLIIGTSAFAAGIKIDGTVNQTVNAERNTNEALGNNSIARQVFGVVNSDVSGTVNRTLNVNDNANTVTGNGSKGCRAFGVVGSLEEVCK